MASGSPSIPEGVQDDPPFPLRLRCGVRPRELGAIWRLHLRSFPIAYNRDYYRWLSGPSCLSVVALTTPAASQAIRGSPENKKTKKKSPAVGEELVSITQLHVRGISDEEGVDFTPMIHSPSDTDDPTAGDNDASEENYSVVIGLAAGEIGYARHQRGYLFTNPTCYLCSLAIDPIFRRLGLGGILLDYFIDYVRNMPLRASLFLHYDPSSIAKVLKLTLFAESSINTASLSNDVNAGVKVGGCADSSKDPAKVGIFTEEGVKERHWIMDAILKSKDLWTPSWMRIRRARERWMGEDHTLDHATCSSNTKNPDLDTLFQGAAPLEGDFAGQDPIVQRGVREVWLHCIAKDLFLMSFYTRRGFQLIRTLKNFYEIGSSYFDASFLVYSAEPSPRGNPHIDANLLYGEENGQPNDSNKLQAQPERVQKVYSSLENNVVGAVHDDFFTSSEGIIVPLFMRLSPPFYQEVDQIVLKSSDKCRQEWKFYMSIRESFSTTQPLKSDTIKEFFFASSALLPILTVTWIIYKIMF
ncbi:unnamed protein product [Phytomonas sp. Hart1]|nr:unnamed protein product [Phytomonas sp. Hart1]|eukprot:CCW69597.1 unnamed protein product [Phytomonas sp. isolate Hart1]